MPILYTFYGDDFTGSTDVLEQLGSHGVRAALFFDAPTPERLARFGELDAIGIAGDSRSRTPEWMTENLPGIFRALKRFNAPVAHYKTCSTFDSSPRVGCIGRAMEIGREIFAPAFVPIVVGAPHLARFVAFGNLFAADAEGVVRRIDRHPMSRHPVTPMREADLRVHLAAQSAMPVGLIDLVALRSSDFPQAVARLIKEGHAAILFDTLDDHALRHAGMAIWSHARPRPIFAVGSSGLTSALIAARRAAGLLPEAAAPALPAPARPMLVVSGSCAEKTRRQIQHACNEGWSRVALDAAALRDGSGAEHTRAVREAAASLAAGRDTVLYTALGPTDAAAFGADLGSALGVLLREILAQSAQAGRPLRRVMICGGDTASHAVQQLGLYALTWSANLQPGAPLCRAHADSDLDGLELVLKGGQVGSDDFFLVVAAGT